MERLGFPSHYSATAAMDAVFGADDGRRYVNGEGADALFGLTGTKGFRAAARFDDLVPQPMAATLTSLPGSLGEYVSTFALQAERARRPPSHPGRSPSSSLSSPTRRWSPTSSASRRCESAPVASTSTSPTGSRGWSTTPGRHSSNWATS